VHLSFLRATPPSVDRYVHGFPTGRECAVDAHFIQLSLRGPKCKSLAHSPAALEFGIYRDGDNNLDVSQSLTLAQALQSSRTDSGVEYTVEDTTGLRVDDGDLVEGKKRTDTFTIADGQVGDPQIGKARNMASESNLAKFVAQTLDDAEASGATQTWIDLVDHGGGDGGGLETHTGAVMSMPDMAQAIADGIAMHAKGHPEDANRGVDGVVANQCLMSTMGFADALSRAGVKYLAASPET
jgi:hypothetical protein